MLGERRMKKLKECHNCNEVYNETKDIRIDFGFARIEQKQCPYCQCPIDTKIIHKEYACDKIIKTKMD